MIIRVSRAAVIAAALLGCDPSAPESSGTGSKRATAFDSNAGHYAVELTTFPDPITVNKPFDVTVKVTPKSGAAAADLDVVVDARMPAHFHGMTRVPKITKSGASTWKAEGLLFHMSGHWELYVDITQGGATERAQMDVELK